LPRKKERYQHLCENHPLSGYPTVEALSYNKNIVASSEQYYSFVGVSNT